MLRRCVIAGPVSAKKHLYYYSITLSKNSWKFDPFEQNRKGKETTKLNLEFIIQERESEKETLEDREYVDRQTEPLQDQCSTSKKMTS